MTLLIGFGFRGLRIVFAQHNWIIYTVLEDKKGAFLIQNREQLAHSLRLVPELSPSAELLPPTELLSLEDASSTPPTLCAELGSSLA